MEDWKTYISKSQFRNGYDVYIYKNIGDGKKMVQYFNGDMIETKVIEEGQAGNGPSLFLMDNIAQALVDELSNKGIKPKQGYLEGKLEATQDHLKDVRTLLKLK